MITGAFSGVISLDFDAPAVLLFHSLGLEAHRRTGSGGFHVDFLHPGWRVRTVNSRSSKTLGKRWPGLDVKGDGGYVVFCGRNSSGAYEWLRDPKIGRAHV